MPLNIKNPLVERLIDEIVALTGESKTEAVRRALEERRARLRFHVADTDRAARLVHLLEREIWPTLPAGERGPRLTPEEEEAILGYEDGG